MQLKESERAGSPELTAVVLRGAQLILQGVMQGARTKGEECPILERAFLLGRWSLGLTNSPKCGGSV